MLQQIITYLIISGAIFYTARSAFLFFKPSQEKTGGCGSACGGSCGLKSEIMQNLEARKNFTPKELI